jgi:hypothetical protein
MAFLLNKFLSTVFKCHVWLFFPDMQFSQSCRQMALQSISADRVPHYGALFLRRDQLPQPGESAQV